MEDLSADDDILSDILLDTLEFEPAISTHKMNPNYRGQRFDRGTVSQMVRKRVVVERDVGAAVEDLAKLGIVAKYLQKKTQRQVAGFQAHARRYLETYLPDSGVEFALTTRYKRVMMERLAAKATPAPVGTLADADTKAGESSTAGQVGEAKPREKPKGRQSLDRAATSIGAAPAASEKADLCVLAMQEFKPGDLISHCKGGLKDLTKSEDEALREEAVSSREKRKEAEYKGVLGPGRDFSVISSSRKGCSQLLLGPARFVNHDCNPNTEFYRMGMQMTFKVIRPISRNEEITTYYGDNYFEWANSECMCATCELKGVGAFADKGDAGLVAAAAGTGIGPGTEDADGGLAEEGQDGASETNGEGRRRLPRRTGRQPGAEGSAVPSPSPTPSASIMGSAAAAEDGSSESKSRRDILADLKLAQHGPSDDRSDPYAEGAGPRCRCLTCGATFWAPEKWWTPDECPRCERHYKIFKADWPDRVPTEGLLARRGSGKRKLDVGLDKESEKSFNARRVEAAAALDQATSANKKRSRPAKAASPPAVPAEASDGGVTPSNPATPITLTPLRDAPPTSLTAGRPIKTKPKDSPLRPAQATGSPLSRPSLPSATGKSSTAGAGPSKAGARSVERKTSAAAATATAIGTPKPTSSSSARLRQDSDDSDLTPESESDSDGERRPTTHGSSAIADAATRSSSSASPGPMGPKMLGKHAKTDVLAQYWGAPMTDKRSRRKSSSQNNPVLLGLRKTAAAAAAGAASAGSPTAGEGRKSAPARQMHASDSDEMPFASSKKGSRKRPVQSTPDEDEDEDEYHDGDGDGDGDGVKEPAHPRPPAIPTAHHRKTASMGDLSGLAAQPLPPAAPPRASSSTSQGQPEPQPKARLGTDAARSTTPVSDKKHVPGTPVAIPGLATTGVQRTSESNLALFWSAGVEGGRTRRQVPREPQMLTAAHTPAKRSRPSSEASRSRTPEVKRPRSKLGNSRTGDSPADGPSPAATSTVRAVKAEDMDVDSGDDSAKDETVRRPLKDAAIRGPGGPLGADPTTGCGNGFPPPAKTPLLPPATLMRPPPPHVRPDLLATAAARSNSPLAGPPPPGLRAGAPGQPIRRNLRWGSGKTSVSRPLGSVSPLGRPLLGPNGSPAQALPRPPMDAARVLQFQSSAGPDQTQSKPLPSAAPVDPANGIATPTQSAPPELETSSLPAPSQSPPAPQPPSNGASVSSAIKQEPALDTLHVKLADVHRPNDIIAEPVGHARNGHDGNGIDTAAAALASNLSSARPAAAQAAEEGAGAAIVDAAIWPVAQAESGAAVPPAHLDDPWTPPPPAAPLLDAGDAPSTVPTLAHPAKDVAASPASRSAISSAPSSPSSNGQSLQRRVSGRARKPPEMAAGQIPYKGSLVKLAAQRAKDAKKGDSPAPRTAASTPQRSPNSTKGHALASPGSPDKLITSLDAAAATAMPDETGHVAAFGNGVAPATNDDAAKSGRAALDPHAAIPSAEGEIVSGSSGMSERIERS
ncbi:uncharacterized protein PFL1_06099 [Pseudozyma flocculosa PF-1]|uniref:SET domain-containing protein n=2 Tax=Pseudozyma flocculosa TaxID=84751 RepID=A0A5C3F380_9BASI|nr:uncharacterized protein PFL1_06099 [Pseudozyma flocculosa PF-1]EPQ26451.1 hypothetical protein PFL1_06099 [Pseudozyma flocculosa PF-1]SPO38954.1 uncharacterized protein PSFLO_04433 [Pseudozyma flocculosa]